MFFLQYNYQITLKNYLWFKGFSSFFHFVVHVNYLNVYKKVNSLYYGCNVILGFLLCFFFFCNSHVGLGVIWYFNIYKWILNLKRCYQQVGTALALWMEHVAPIQRWMPSSEMAFEAPHHPRHGGETCVRWRSAEEHRQRVFLFLPLFPLST